MRSIVKGAEPASLTEHRTSAHADYANYADKSTLRRHLVAEQRGLCCFCLSRIRPTEDAMKIAHWHSQDRHPDEQLDYRNLLGACLGGQGRDPKNQHCDTYQGNRDLSRNPADPAHAIDSFITYSSDGSVRSTDPVLDRELDDVLHLNIAFLKNNRKAVLAALLSALTKRGGELAHATLERMLRDWNGESDAGELKPYCQVVVHWLRKRLARA